MPGAAEIEKLVVSLVGNSSHFDRTLARAERNILPVTKSMDRATMMAARSMNLQLGRVGLTLDGLVGKMRSTSARLKSIGSALTRYVSLPLTAVAGLSVKQFASFDDAMVKSTSIMTDVTEDLRKEMEATAKQIAGRSITAPEKLAEAYYFLASAGLSAKASINALAVVERFAVAGAFDMARATDLLTDAQSALGLSFKDPIRNQKEMIKLSDQLVRAAQLANTSVEQVAEALTNDAATASRQFGMETATTLAILDKYGDAGKKGAEAGSLLGRATRLLSGAFQENGKAFEKYGIRVVDEATGEYRNFIDIIADMEEAFKDMTGPQKAAALEQLGFAALAQKSITPLIGSSKAMREYEAELRKAAGTTEKVANKQMKSFTAEMKILWNNVKLVAIEIGRLLAPAVRWLGERLRGVLTWFKQLSPTMQKVLVLIGVLVGAIGPLVTLLAFALGSFAAISAGVSALAAAISAISLPVAAAVVGVLALVAALAALVVYFVGPENLMELFGKAANAVKNFVVKSIGFFANFRTNIKALWEWIQQNWTLLAVDLGNLMGTVFDNMLQNAQHAAMISQRIFTALSGWLLGVFSNLFSVDVLKIFAFMLVAMAKLTQKFAIAVAKAILNALKGQLPNLSKLQKDLMSGFGKGQNLGNIGQTLTDIMNEEKGGFVNPLAGFESVLKEGPKLTFKWGKEAGQALPEGIKEALEEGEPKVAAAAKKLAEAAAPMSEELKSTISDLEEQINTFGMSSQEVELYRLAMKGATGDQLEYVHALQETLGMLNKEKDLMEKAKSLTEKYLSPGEKFNKQQEELQELLNKGLISMDTYNKALEDARKQTDKDFKVKFKVSGIDAVEAGTADAMARLAEFRALKVTVPAGANPNNTPKPMQGLNPTMIAKESAKKNAGIAQGNLAHEIVVQKLLGEIAGNTKAIKDRKPIILEEVNLEG